MLSTAISAVIGLVPVFTQQTGAAPTTPAIPPPTPQTKPIVQDPEDLDDLRFRVETLEMELERLRRETAVPAPTSKNSFNPQLTVFGNFLARSDSAPVYVDGDPSAARIDDSINLREVELDFRAAVDPWADGVLIFSSEAEVPGEYETGVEEGYVTLKRLPVLDSAPGGLKLKAGRFRASFGRFNKIHLHDLPQADYPHSLGSALGPEGYIGNGFSGQFFLPSPSASTSFETTLELLGGGGMPLADDLDPGDAAGLGHVTWFQELDSHNNTDLGLSYWTANGDRSLWGADATYKWKPLAGGDAHSFLLGGEVFQSDVSDAGLQDTLGWYAWSQYQLTRNAYVGARYDSAEEPVDASLSTRTTTLYLTYYTTEFMYMRLGGAHTDSDLAELDGVDTVYLELNFIFGSHPAEPYWVNR